MIRLWQPKAGNPWLILPLILFGKLNISVYSYRPTTPNFQTAEGLVLLPGSSVIWGGALGQRSLWAHMLPFQRSGVVRPWVWAYVEGWHVAVLPHRFSRMQWWQSHSLYLPWTTSRKYQDKAKASILVITFLLFLSFILIVGGGMEKMKKAPGESKKNYMFGGLEGGIILMKTDHMVKKPKHNGLRTQWTSPESKMWN